MTRNTSIPAQMNRTTITPSTTTMLLSNRTKAEHEHWWRTKIAWTQTRLCSSVQPNVQVLFEMSNREREREI